MYAIPSLSAHDYCNHRVMLLLPPPPSLLDFLFICFFPSNFNGGSDCAVLVINYVFSIYFYKIHNLNGSVYFEHADQLLYCLRSKCIDVDQSDDGYLLIYSSALRFICVRMSSLLLKMRKKKKTYKLTDNSVSFCCHL